MVHLNPHCHQQIEFLMIIYLAFVQEVKNIIE
jgi:hypothetical protein